MQCTRRRPSQPRRDLWPWSVLRHSPLLRGTYLQVPLVSLVVIVHKIKDEDEALKLANASECQHIN